MNRSGVSVNPRERGVPGRAYRMFPASAGMNRFGKSPYRQQSNVPRERGDEPGVDQ